MTRIGVGSTRVSEAAIQRDRDSARARWHGRNHDVKVKEKREYRAHKLEERPFVCWDSEGYDAFAVDSFGVCEKLPQRTMLFMCSDGDYVAGTNEQPWVTTEQMLDLILEVEARNPDVFHVGYSFEYDVNQILMSLEPRFLAVLKALGKVRWHGYRISHIPHKVFRVTKDGISATIYDSFGYFHTKYEKALEKYGIGDEQTLATIARGKSQRGHFTFADLPEVSKYCALELALMPRLMEQIREASYTGGYRIAAWHGPGALASYALKANDANKYHSKRVPPGVESATRHAYAGGRFQAWQCGEYYGPVYTLDKNSAYVQAISILPRLDNGRWRRSNPRDIKGPNDIARFGLYYISFTDTAHERKLQRMGYPPRPYPLFHRDKRGTLCWPSRVDGWYWSPEARLVAGNSHAEFHEAWIYEDDGTYPFRWVEDTYSVRLRYKNPDHYSPAEKAYKWALAAIYGAFARRVGWDKKARKPPRSHELAWAGFITSHCRAAIYDVAEYAYRKGALISVDTDGVTATCPFPENIVPEGFGDHLGQWKQDKYDGIVYWQNGIYWLFKDGEWVEAKSRGVPKGRIPVEAAKATLHGTSFTSGDMQAIIRLDRTRFVGYRQALNGQTDKWRLWETKPIELKMGGGGGKGLHNPALCRKCLYPGKWEMHVIQQMLFDREIWDRVSQPHRLPWLEDQPEDLANHANFRSFILADNDIVADKDLEENL